MTNTPFSWSMTTSIFEVDVSPDARGTMTLRSYEPRLITAFSSLEKHNNMIERQQVVERDVAVLKNDVVTLYHKVGD